MAWIPRQNKTRQDLMPNRGDRSRVKDWDKRLSFMQNSKPTCSRDWNKFKQSNVNN